MKAHLLNRLALSFTFLLIGLGACEKPDPEVVISGVIRAKINGQPWESTQIVWGSSASRGISYPGRGNVPLDIYVTGQGNQTDLYLSLSGQRNIFSLTGKLDPLYSMQRVTVGGKTYIGEPNNTIIELLKADTVSRTIEGRFRFQGACCFATPRSEEFVEVTDGYFKLVFP